MNGNESNHYATADFDEPLTAYMEYSYDQDTDWKSMLDNGENLLWYYDKTLDLAYNSSAADLLPKRTQLILVDRQTKQYYTYTITGEEEVHSFNLSVMKKPDGQTGFAPVYICDLLGLKAEPVANPQVSETYYVVEEDVAKATVRVGTTYYRKAVDSDEDVDKYSITVTNASVAHSEGYYLTIQVPKTENRNIVNNCLNYASFSRKPGTLPAVIKSSAASSGSNYVVSKGVEQTFTVSTTRVHNGSEVTDTVMENGDSIKITLSSKLQLTEEGKQQFANLGPAEVHHQFDISLKKYLKNIGNIDIIGTEEVKYTYTLSGNGLNQSETGSISNAAAQDTLTLHYGSSELKRALEKATTDATAITVTAVITLTYAGADHFPVRNTADNSDSSGIAVVGVSRIANTESQLPITGNKESKEDGKRYYITNPSKAILTYNAIDETNIGDTTQQLGVNPLDSANNQSDTIYTRADYDYSNVDAAVLKTAVKIRYRMELFQKNETGIYDESSPLVIGDYLWNTKKGGSDLLLINSGPNAYQWEDMFTSNDAKHQSAKFSFAPLTGDEFEKKNHSYANYRVRLTAVLLDKDGKELDGTKASDYIIYTNARIYQELLNELQNTESENGQ